MNDFLFTSESVTEGHPDKISDQISDLILDEALKQDLNSKVACETLVTKGLVFVSGEMRTNAYIDLNKKIRGLIKNIGYDDPSLGFSYDSCAIINSIQSQSADIAYKVKNGGAGDQGIMFGYATSESEEYMPIPILYANRLVKCLSKLRKSNKEGYLCPDGKAQITIEYKNNKPVSVRSVVISTQHKDWVDLETLNDFLVEELVYKVIDKRFRHRNMNILINPGGRFVIGGPRADCGLTGRKIIVDTYGGFARHGGGAFSGKDPSKVDRSASYMGRYLAKNIVSAGICDRCEIQLSYAIGVLEPISIYLNTFSTLKVKISDELLAYQILKNFDLTPRGIIKYLNLLNPIYQKTASYGHFGRNIFEWEKNNIEKELLALI